MSTPFATPERELLRSTVGMFMTTEVLRHLDSWERAGEVPRAVHRAAGSLGLLGTAFPEHVGGGGGDLVDAMVVVEEMHYAGASGGLIAALLTCGIALPHIVAAGDREQIERWVRPTLAGELIGSLAITEPDGGSDVASVRTTAKREGDEYVVNGAKTFITSGCRADFVTTAVRTGDPGAHGISLLVVEKDTPGFTVGPQAGEDGLAVLRHGRTVLRGLPGARGQPGRRGEHRVRADLRRTSSPSGSRLAVQAYAAAQRALDLTVSWCRMRETFGRPLISRQSVQHTLAEMARRVDVARTYTRDVALRHLAGARRDRPGVLRQEHRRRGR